MVRCMIEPDNHKLHMVVREWSLMLNPVVVNDPFVEEEVRGGVKCKKTCHTGMPHQHGMLMLSNHVPVPVPGTGMGTWGIIL